METRRLGENGPELSVIGLGCNTFGVKLTAEESAAVIRAAYEAGVTHFDTAEMYGDGRSEEIMGAVLSAHRDEVVLATKFSPRPDGEPFTPGALRRRAVEACEASLRRLDTDYIDVYYEHYPDDDAPLDEVLEAFAELVDAGKVRWAASSNGDAARLVAAQRLGSRRGLPSFTGAQVEWSLLHRDPEAELAPGALDLGIGVVPYYPLASGMLTGKYRTGEPYPEGSRFGDLPAWTIHDSSDNFARVDALTAVAEETGLSMIEIAVGWLVSQPAVASVIVGASTPEQVQQNVAAAVHLTATDRQRIVAAIA